MMPRLTHRYEMLQSRRLGRACGNRDEYALHYGVRLFARRLTELDIAHTHQEFDGGHRSTQFRDDVSLKAISQTFGE